MNVASLELCKELYELSGWDDTTLAYFQYEDGSIEVYQDPKYGDFVAHAYDLGYLLKKLSPGYGVFNLTHDDLNNQWWFSDVVSHKFIVADTPEDAACRLAIALFKQKILTREEKQG